MALLDRLAAVLAAAATPVVELRGAIPLALALGFSPWEAWFWSVLGNMVPVPGLLWGLRAVLRLLERVPRVRAVFDAWAGRKSRRLAEGMARWGLVGLALFVAVPLPGTGAWTGAVAACLLGIPPRRALAAIGAGVAAAGGLVTTVGAAALAVGG